MSEKETAVTAATEEVKENKCKYKCGILHRLFSLKNLARIYKILSALVLVYLVVILGMLWYVGMREGAPISEALIATLQFILTYGFYALLMYTIAVVLMSLKKIRHAVEHK